MPFCLSLQRQTSVMGPRLRASELANLPSNVKTERIEAHINQLINANNDILLAPKAAAPRTKRPRLTPSKSGSESMGSMESFDSPSTPMVRVPLLHSSGSGSSGSMSSVDTPTDYMQVNAMHKIYCHC